MNRLHNLDYLRGLAAFGIMIYHYSIWEITKFNSCDFLGRIGIYGVSIFYILSGLTLCHVYYNKIEPSIRDVKDFYLKRFLRIYPLLWLASVGTLIVYQFLPSMEKAVLNFSGIFSIYKNRLYIPKGAWSIGNELAFYLIFPLFIFFHKKVRPLFFVLIIMTFIVFVIFCYYIMQVTISLNDQWSNYINPLNQVFLFSGGFCLVIFFRENSISQKLVFILLMLSVALFIFYPTNGELIALLTDSNRIVFSIISIVICFCMFKLSVELPKCIDIPLRFLGEVSYSIYLLHPLVYASVIKLRYFMLIPNWLLLIICIPLTICSSWLTYEYFEKFFIRKGKVVVKS